MLVFGGVCLALSSRCWSGEPGYFAFLRFVICVLPVAAYLLFFKASFVGYVLSGHLPRYIEFVYIEWKCGFFQHEKVDYSVVTCNNIELSVLYLGQHKQISKMIIKYPTHYFAERLILFSACKPVLRFQLERKNVWIFTTKTAKTIGLAQIDVSFGKNLLC